LAPSLKAIHHGSKNHAQERELRNANASCSRKRGANSGNLQTRQQHNSKRVQRHNNNTPWYNAVPSLKAIHHGSKLNAQQRKSHDANASCSRKRGAMGGNLGDQHIIPANTIKNVVEMPKNQPVKL
jgi:hypothetical protein